MKILNPLPHAIIDYAWAVQMMSSPWCLGFSKNRRARMSAVGGGAGIIGLSLMTRYPLGAIKAIPFPVHGVIETIAGISTIAAPWACGFAANKRARWSHVISGLATLAVVAMTDYRATDRPNRDYPRRAERVGEKESPNYQVSTAAEYDQYSAQPPYTHFGDTRKQEELLEGETAASQPERRETN